MDFFKQLFPLMEGTEKATITIIRKGDTLTVGFLPEMKSDDVNKRLNILNLKGTAEELDEGFFSNATQQIQVATGVQTNIDEVTKELIGLNEEKKKSLGEKQKQAKEDIKKAKETGNVAKDKPGKKQKEKPAAKAKADKPVKEKAPKEKKQEEEIVPVGGLGF